MTHLYAQRVLAGTLIEVSGIRYNCIISRDTDGILCARDFVRETHSTPFIDTVVIIGSTELSGAVIDQLERFSIEGKTPEYIYYELLAAGTLADIVNGTPVVAAAQSIIIDM